MIVAVLCFVSKFKFCFLFQNFKISNTNTHKKNEFKKKQKTAELMKRLKPYKVEDQIMLTNLMHHNPNNNNDENDNSNDENEDTTNVSDNNNNTKNNKQKKTKVAVSAAASTHRRIQTANKRDAKKIR